MEDLNSFIESLRTYTDNRTKYTQVREVVPIEDWVNDEYYVGPAGMNLYPYWKQKMIEVFSKPTNEIIVTGGLGTGKSTFGIFCLIRKLYELSCYKNVPALFQLMPGSPITFIYFTITKIQAERTGFGQLRNAIDLIPYFRDLFARDEHISSMLKFPEDIRFIYGSSAAHSIGMNLIGSILDEANFFNAKASANMSDYSKVAELYTAIVNRGRSRFRTSKQDSSLSILISSNTTASSFVENHIQEVKHEPNVAIINTRVWEVKKPGTYSDERFWVFIGSDMLDATVINDINEVFQFLDTLNLPRPDTDKIEDIFKIYPQIQEYFIDVPIDFRKQFDLNVISSLQDVAGISVAPSGRLFSSTKLYGDMCNSKQSHPFTKEQIVVTTADDVPIKSYLRKDWFPQKRWKKRYIHIDQSLSHDSTGIAMSYIDRFIKAESGLYEPIIDTELLIRINPPKPPAQISISKVREFILYLREYYDLDFGYISLDSFGSEESLQILEKEGINCGTLSVDRTDRPYLSLISLIYDHRLESYHYEPLRKELFELVHLREQGKVDHPSDGCFTYDTKILLPNGTSVAIGELAESNDKRIEIFAYDLEKKEFVVAKTKNIFKTKTVTRLCSIIDNNGNVTDCTEDHKFLLSNNRWKRAKNLKPGDKLKSFNNAVILDTQISKVSPTQVYDMEVPYFSNYIIEPGVVVHNSKDICDAWCGSVWNALTQSVDEVPNTSLSSFTDTVNVNKEDSEWKPITEDELKS